MTPFTDGGGIDYTRMAWLIEKQISGGTSALVVCGTTGEAATLTEDEHEALVDFCVRQSRGRMKVIAGVGGNSTAKALALAKSAEASGADGILMVTPYYNKTTQRGLVQHFTYVADRVSLPMVLYNVPSRTAIAIEPATYKILSAHPNINGVKEAGGSIDSFARSLALCGDELCFWSGNDSDTIAMMSMGACGVISVASNIIPRTVAHICRLCLAGDFFSASALCSRYWRLIGDLFIEVNPIPVKTAMNLLGMEVGPLRLPLCDMSPEHLKALKATLAEADII